MTTFDSVFDSPGASAGLGVSRLALLVSAAATLASAALLALVAVDGARSLVVNGPFDTPLVGVMASEVTAVLLFLVTAVSTLVQGFSARYLHGDRAARRFFGTAAALSAATAVMVTSATLVTLALAWSVASIALVHLLRLYDDLPGGREGTRRVARTFLIGDLALWSGVALATATWGAVDLRDLGDTAAGLVSSAPTTAGVFACLLVVAAMARSAQLPFHAWLPATVAAPTPASALLHAGVVNGGGILLVKLSAFFGASVLATHVAFVAGAATIVVGVALMLTKADVKGALASSTLAQMGFTILTCGLGAYAAAIFHLVGHGFYKATMFLGSGAAVGRHTAAVSAPPRPALTRAVRSSLVAVAVVWPAVVLGAALAAVGVAEIGGSEVLLAFGAATAAAMTWGWVVRRPSVRGVAGAIAAVGILLPLYVVALHEAKVFMDPALAGAGSAHASPWLLAAPVVALAGLLAIRAGALPSRLRGLARPLYVGALNAGYVAPPRRPHATPDVARPLVLTVSTSESAGRP